VYFGKLVFESDEQEFIYSDVTICCPVRNVLLACMSRKIASVIIHTCR